MQTLAKFIGISYLFLCCNIYAADMPQAKYSYIIDNQTGSSLFTYTSGKFCSFSPTTLPTGESQISLQTLDSCIINFNANNYFPASCELQISAKTGQLQFYECMSDVK